MLEDNYSAEPTALSDAGTVFVAIGHTPTTLFLEGVVELDPDHAGYVLNCGESMGTSVAGVLACGNVSDSVS